MVIVQPSGRKSWTIQCDQYEERPDRSLRLLGTRRRRIGSPDAAHSGNSSSTTGTSLTSAAS